MKIMSKITIGLVTAAILLVGCGNTAQPAKKANAAKTITEEQLSYRNTSLYSEADTAVKASQYSSDGAGTSKKIARAFQDAPPMIPHDTEGMLPITRKDGNQCINCHMPEVAASMGATPIPPSHFLNMRPDNKVVNGTFKPEGNVLANTTSVKKENTLYAGRWNCSQCHAPQSNAKLITANKFQADYLSKDGAFKSHWDEQVMKSLDTVGSHSNVTSADIANKNSAAGESVFKKH